MNIKRDHDDVYEYISGTGLVEKWGKDASTSVAHEEESVQGMTSSS